MQDLSFENRLTEELNITLLADQLAGHNFEADSAFSQLARATNDMQARATSARNKIADLRDIKTRIIAENIRREAVALDEVTSEYVGLINREQGAIERAEMALEIAKKAKASLETEFKEKRIETEEQLKLDAAIALQNWQDEFDAANKLLRMLEAGLGEAAFTVTALKPETENNLSDETCPRPTDAVHKYTQHEEPTK